jgi:hypothetical protein
MQMKKLGSNYRVQVSRMMLTPFKKTGFPLMTGEFSVPNAVAHSYHSPHVTADPGVTESTSLSLTRINLSILRVIAVTHY